MNSLVKRIVDSYDLSSYKNNGYKFNHVAVRFDCVGRLEAFAGYKSTLEREIYNGELPHDLEILTFRQAALKYPENFEL